MTRAEAKTDRPKTLFVRRLLILLLFGFLHYVLLWDGDILHTYAITGFFLFLFYKRKPRTILIWSIVLLSFMQLFTLLGSLVMLIVPVEGVRPFHSNYAVRKLGLTNHRPILFSTLKQ